MSNLKLDNKIDIKIELESIIDGLKGYVKVISETSNTHKVEAGIKPEIEAGISNNQNTPKQDIQEVQSNEFAEALDKTKSQLEDLADTLTRFFSPLYNALTPKTTGTEPPKNVLEPTEPLASASLSPGDTPNMAGKGQQNGMSR
jgi:hypothetical protein